MFKNLFLILVFGLMVSNCQKKSWYQTIEKFSQEELETFDLSEDDDVAFRTDIINFKTPFHNYPKSAFKALLNTQVFSDCCGPEPKLPVISYQVLMNQPERKEIFLELLNRANNAGKVYALIALSEIDYKLFVEKVTPFLNDSSLIHTYITDLNESANFNELLVSNWSKNNLLEGKTVTEWLEDNPFDTRDTLKFESINHLDVINGGWKQNFDAIENYTKLKQE